MDAILNQTSLVCFEKTFSQTICREELQDSIVPDRLPDIVSVISAGGTALIRSKDVADGRIRIEANVPARVSYYSEANEICCIDVNVPFYLSVDSPEIEEGDVCIVGMTLTELTAKVHNPRKISVSAAIEFKLDCYQQQELAFPADPQEEPSPVHARIATADLTFVSAVSEKTFALTEELELDAGCPSVEEIMEQNAVLDFVEVKTLGAKLLLKGSARSSLLYRSGERQVAAAAFETPFTQIIDLNCSLNEGAVDATMLLSGLYFDTTPGYDGTTLKMELHAVVQVCIYQTTELRYLSEAYSNCFDLSVRRDARMISCIRRCLQLRETLREQIELPRDVTELIAFHADPGEITEKDNTASVRILLTLVCQKEDGACHVVRKAARARLTAEAAAGERLRITATTIGDANAALSGNGAEARLSITAEAQIIADSELNCISQISYDEDTPLDLSAKPSLVIMKLQNTDDLWEIARDNCSTVEAIEAANDLDRSGAPWEKPVLIPRSL